MRSLLLTAAASLALAAPAAAAPAAVFDGDTIAGTGIPCSAQEGVVFCSGSGANRVRTFDEVPLDVNVALPASGSGPFPLVIHIHGWGGQREGLSEGKKWASRGYAWMSVTARGFNGSCGTAQNRGDAACAHGWIRLADSRYEVRDLQHLAGLLADEGVADPQRVGAYGGSYGGGQSTMLAVLRDRVRNVDGSYAPWVSPEKKLPMRLAAAVPSIPWTDLVYSLNPNGRTLDYTVVGKEDLAPIGVMKHSFVSGLYALGNATGFYAPPGADPEANLHVWYARTSAGDPDIGDPIAQEAVDAISGLKSPYYLEMDRPPAPTLISNGFTDDIFPVDEAVRYVNKVKALHPGAVIAQLHFDYGHQRGQNKEADTAVLARERLAWMERYLKGDDGTTVLDGVTVLAQTCPKDAPSAGPYNAATWDALSPGEVRFADGARKTVVSAGGDPTRNRTWDPIVGGNNPCATNSASETPGSATWTVPAASGAGFTLAGSPTFIADVDATGPNPSFAARLLDVAPDGKQTLIARGLFRPEVTGRQVFQLHPNTWRFAPGHEAKLELLGHDEPYSRIPNMPASIAFANVELRLPALERPDCSQVLSPREPFLPAGAVLAPGVDRSPADVCQAVRGERVTASAACLPRARASRTGIGAIRLGRRPPAFGRRSARRAARNRRVLTYCVSGGGKIVVVTDARGRARVIRFGRTVIKDRRLRGAALRQYLRLAR